MIGQQQYSCLYSHGQIALSITRAIIGHTHTGKSSDYYPNCTQKCVINYINYVSLAMSMSHSQLITKSLKRFFFFFFFFFFFCFGVACTKRKLNTRLIKRCGV